MLYAVTDAGGAVVSFVWVPEGAPPYVPPSGKSLREATDEERAVHAPVVLDL